MGMSSMQCRGYCSAVLVPFLASSERSSKGQWGFVWLSGPLNRSRNGSFWGRISQLCKSSVLSPKPVISLSSLEHFSNSFVLRSLTIVVTYITMSRPDLGQAYMGQMTAPSRLKSCHACPVIISLSHTHTQWINHFSESLAQWLADFAFECRDSSTTDIESIRWHCQQQRDACFLAFCCMQAPRSNRTSDHFTCHTSYRQQAGRSSRTRNPRIAGWSCLGRPEWRAPVRLGWISHTA